MLFDFVPYQPTDVGQLYNVRTQTFQDAAEKIKSHPSADDRQKIILLIVDALKDFVFEDGALSVKGAIPDTQRTIELIYRYWRKISRIIVVKEIHPKISIFFPSWWIDPKSGEHPLPLSRITKEDVRSGKWVPLYDVAWSKYYVEQVDLDIWPEHTLEGTDGHIVVPALQEAIAFHSAVRQTEPITFTKGTVPQTDQYGAFAQVVPFNQSVLVPQLQVIAKEAAAASRIITLGQAYDFCLYWTTKQLSTVSYFTKDTISKVTLVTDCTSSVLPPDSDHGKQISLGYDQLKQQGLTMADSLSLDL